MSKDTKMARNMMKLMRRYVQKYYPEETDTLMAEIEKYYRQFKAECPDLGGDGNMLAGNLDMGLIVFAAYEASGSYKSYKKKLDQKLAAGEWGNTWGMEINPDGHDAKKTLAPQVLVKKYLVEKGVYYETDSKIITRNVSGNAYTGYGSTCACLAKAGFEISAQGCI